MHHNEKIPSRDECLELMALHNMLPHIKAHSLMVCSFALSLAQALNENGGRINLSEIEAAALLHDITKTQSLETGEDHAKTGGELLLKLGFTGIARIVQEHIIPFDRDASVSIEEIISYADKRVLHDRVVTLDERFEYLFQRYGRNEQAVTRIRRAKARAGEIEHKIIATLNSKAYDILKAQQ